MTQPRRDTLALLSPAQREHYSIVLSGSQGLRLTRLFGPILRRLQQRLHRHQRLIKERASFAYPPTSRTVLDCLHACDALNAFAIDESDAIRDIMAHHARFKCFDVDEVLVPLHETASVTGIIILVAGEVVIRRDGATTTHLSAPAVIGDDRILTDERSPDTISAATLVSFYVLPYVHVREALCGLMPRHLQALRERYGPRRVAGVQAECRLTNDFLKRCWFTSKIAASDLNSLSRCLLPECFFPHDRIITQGDTSTSMYFLCRGSVEVVVNGTVVAKLRPPVSFGEMSLIFKEERNATIVATSICDVWVLSEGDYRKFLMNCPQYEKVIYETAVSIRAQRLSTGQTSAEHLVSTALSKLEIFADASDRAALGRDLFRVAKPIVVFGQSTVASTSEHCRSLLVISRGTAMSQRSDYPQRYGSGSVLGEYCLVRHRWPFPVCSLSMIDAFEISYDSLVDVLRQHKILSAARRRTFLALENHLFVLGSAQPLQSTGSRSPQAQPNPPRNSKPPATYPRGSRRIGSICLSESSGGSSMSPSLERSFTGQAISMSYETPSSLQSPMPARIDEDAEGKKTSFYDVTKAMLEQARSAEGLTMLTMLPSQDSLSQSTLRRHDELDASFSVPMYQSTMATSQVVRSKAEAHRHSYAPPPLPETFTPSPQSLSFVSPMLSPSRKAFEWQDEEEHGLLDKIYSAGLLDANILQAAEEDLGHNPPDFLHDALNEEELSTVAPTERPTERSLSMSSSSQPRVDVVVGSASLGLSSRPFPRRKVSSASGNSLNSSPSTLSSPGMSAIRLSAPVDLDAVDVELDTQCNYVEDSSPLHDIPATGTEKKPARRPSVKKNEAPLNGPNQASTSQRRRSSLADCVARRPATPPRTCSPSTAFRRSNTSPRQLITSPTRSAHGTRSYLVIPTSIPTASPQGKPSPGRGKLQQFVGPHGPQLIVRP